MVTAAVSSVVLHPPASPFAELLRRSRFATYDPAIRQAYRTPSANAHRGDWGLKRPISLRRRDSFISINGTFDTHAHFVEWNSAEGEVRFIRRMEEMDVTPRVGFNTPWDKSVGNAKYQLLLDSEFCPGEGYEMDPEAEEDIKRKNMSLGLTALGNNGPGNYGAQRGPPMPRTGYYSGQVTENFEAMPTKEFSRYLRKLRKLRPAFAEFVQQHKHLRKQSLYSLAQTHEQSHHRQFLQNHIKNEFDSRKIKIQQQPHPNAGFMYAHTSPLETQFHTKPQPGIVLNRVPQLHPGRFANSSRREDNFVASFGGLAAILSNSNSGGKRPVLDIDSDTGVDQARIDESITDMRPMRIDLTVPPKVVGRGATGLKGVQIEATVTAKEAEFATANPYRPGSIEYNTCNPGAGKGAAQDFTRALNEQMVTWNSPMLSQSQSATNTRRAGVMGTLQSIVNRGSRFADGSEQDL